MQGIATTTTISAVTSGPAIATRNSCPGERVSLLIFITPPKKNRSMPLTVMPSRRAANACPSSCSTIEPKNPNAEATAVQKAICESSRTSSNDWLSQKMKRNRTANHETLTPMRMPKIVASRMELPPSTGLLWWHSLAHRPRSSAPERRAHTDSLAIEEMNG